MVQQNSFGFVCAMCVCFADAWHVGAYIPEIGRKQADNV
jgi:hypothetical protein